MTLPYGQICGCMGPGGCAPFIACGDVILLCKITPHPSALRAATFPKGEGKGEGTPSPCIGAGCLVVLLQNIHKNNGFFFVLALAKPCVG